jgi:outer membrane immunogenic protein
MGSPIMAYLTGGLAYGKVKNDGTFTGFNIVGQPISGSTQLPSPTRAGWTIGAGVEAPLGGNWTAKIEYLHVDLGAVTVVPAIAPGSVRSRVTDDVLRVGVNYQFR